MQGKQLAHLYRNGKAKQLELQAFDAAAHEGIEFVHSGRWGMDMLSYFSFNESMQRLTKG